MARGIQINTDFQDYYDHLGNREDPLFVYNRYYGQSMPRGEALNFMRDKGIKTVDIGLARDFIYMYNKVVVYTDVMAHQFKGKQIMSTREAMEMYPAYLTTPYYETTNGVTIKFIQVGRRRFNITLKKYVDSVEEGEIIKLDEATPMYNHDIRKPIYSIDYIFDGEGMVCIDFNEVQKLEGYGIENIMTPQEVMDEIKDAILAYNII